MAATTYKLVFANADASIRKTADLNTTINSIRTTHPGGVNRITIGQASGAGWKLVQDKPGIIAILIGLLLPAVQKLEMAGSPELPALLGLLRPGGSAGIAMGDGSVRPIRW